MIPIGTRVIVTDARHAHPERLNGRKGVVAEHIEGDDCPNVVTGLNRFERLLGVWSFGDDELTPDPDAPSDDDTKTGPAGKPGDQVVMRFLTQGGATVELHTQTFRQAYNTRREGAEWVHDWRDADGFNWQCTGCHTVGKDYGAYDEYKPIQSRHDANRHAETCRAMPPISSDLH